MAVKYWIMFSRKYRTQCWICQLFAGFNTSLLSHSLSSFCSPCPALFLRPFPLPCNSFSLSYLSPSDTLHSPPTFPSPHACSSLPFPASLQKSTLGWESVVSSPSGTKHLCALSPQKISCWVLQTTHQHSTNLQSNHTYKLSEILIDVKLFNIRHVQTSPSRRNQALLQSSPDRRLYHEERQTVWRSVAVQSGNHLRTKRYRSVHFGDEVTANEQLRRWVIKRVDADRNVNQRWGLVGTLTNNDRECIQPTCLPNLSTSVRYQHITGRHLIRPHIREYTV